MRTKSLSMVLVLVLAAAVALPAQARYPDPIPDADCDSCLCDASRCEIEAGRRYDICNHWAKTVGDFFACETGLDSNLLGCAIEYAACLFSPFR